MRCLLLSHIQETLEKKLTVNNSISIEVKKNICQNLYNISNSVAFLQKKIKTATFKRES